MIGVTIAPEQVRNSPPVSPPLSSYLLALREAGSAPVLIPSGLEETVWLEVYARLDGLLFPGGGDLALPCYGSDIQPSLEQPDPRRDRLEITLCQMAIQDRKPFLGICRGLQVLNVCQGGTLYADLVEQIRHEVCHNYPVPAWPPDYPAHQVSIAIDSLLGQILAEERLIVNSRHHQGIREVGEGLRPCAWAPDGLVEALQVENHPFGLAVQWHPEAFSTQVTSQRLFCAFIQACAQGAHSREQVL